MNVAATEQRGSDISERVVLSQICVTPITIFNKKKGNSLKIYDNY
jgi:hypothetical protein